MLPCATYFILNVSDSEQRHISHEFNFEWFAAYHDFSPYVNRERKERTLVLQFSLGYFWSNNGV